MTSPESWLWNVPPNNSGFGCYYCETYLNGYYCVTWTENSDFLKHTKKRRWSQFPLSGENICYAHAKQHAKWYSPQHSVYFLKTFFFFFTLPQLQQQHKDKWITCKEWFVILDLCIIIQKISQNTALRGPTHYHLGTRKSIIYLLPFGMYCTYQIRVNTIEGCCTETSSS